jgi:hypothetical protein
MRRTRASFLRKGVFMLVTFGIVFWTTELTWFMPRSLLEVGIIPPQVYSIAYSSPGSVASTDSDVVSVPEKDIGTYGVLRGPEWSQVMKFVNQNTRACAGKEHLLMIFFQTGKTKLSPEDCEALPYWAEVVSLYGEAPIVHGMETCEAYRASLSWEGIPVEPDPRIAGLFNSGTNEFADVLRLNVKPVDRKQELHAPNGKHTPLSNKSWYQNESLRKGTPLIPFPIVVIRDPYRWMTSMCKRPYIAQWVQGLNGHCPNLVPTDVEKENEGYQNVTSTFQVIVPHPVVEHYDSLADMWSSFYREYFDTNEPRLIIRYEDTLFHAEQVAQMVSKCLGVPFPDKFRFPMSPSKSTGDHVSFLDALSKYGREDGRYGGLTDEDRDYAQNTLDPALMQAFQYPYAPKPREQQIHERVNNLVAESTHCHGKENLIEILLRAGVTEVSESDCERLPSWMDVSRLYGDEPVIIGLETCQAFQSQQLKFNKTGLPKIRVGGLYNTGTNALVDGLMLNYERLDNRLDYNLPGWKHEALRHRVFKNNALSSDILPVIVVRDPLRWMKSMCKLRYDLKWMDGLPGHCPNLVPNALERDLDQYKNVTLFEVYQTDRVIDVRYDSLADMWTDWNRGYFDATFPRLLIRFEDTLFHAEKIMQVITSCVGRPIKQRFRYKLDKAKDTRKSSDFISALETYGRETGRYSGYSSEDLTYASKALDSTLMKAFHYPSIPVARSLEDASEVSSRIPGCRGKERLVCNLLKAGKEDWSEADCDSLPFWTEVEHLYGQDPVIFGLDTCADFRKAYKAVGKLPRPRVGGLFNTGTNAFVDALMRNLEALGDRLDYNLMLGKHSSLKFKAANNSEWLSPDVLPIILVRDPYRWFASMCKLPYKAAWMPGLERHCPNLVPSAQERAMAKYRNISTFEVQVRNQERYASLADMWTSWYQQYIDADFPRLIIRLEDTLFHLEKVLAAVLDCLGEPVTSNIRYSLENAKDTSKSSDLLTAIVKYGHEDGRYGGMTVEDHDYARVALDPELMKTFGYSYAPLKNQFSIDVRISRVVSRFVACEGKEKLLGILLRAGKDDVTREDCERLPKWDEVSSLYGDEPIILGLDTCERFRKNLKALNQTGALIEPFVRVAGLFNTGTNALSQSLSLNVKHVNDPKEYDVPAGKHVPSKPIWISTFAREMDKRKKVLPVVLLRDPLRWMQSMCKDGYNAKWMKGLHGRCPNLVPTDEEKMLDAYRNMSVFNITVSMKNMKYFDHYKSLADMWTEWNRIYYDFETPRLMVRFEDTLFHAEKVMKQITECAGIKMDRPFLYQLDSSKKDSKGTADFLTALAKYGRRYGRLDGLFPRDIAYLRQALDPELMGVFHYLTVDQTISSTTTHTSGLVYSEER